MRDAGDAFTDANYHVATRCKHGDVMSLLQEVSMTFPLFFFLCDLARPRIAHTRKCFSLRIRIHIVALQENALVIWHVLSWEYDNTLLAYILRGRRYRILIIIRNRHLQGRENLLQSTF